MNATVWNVPVAQVLAKADEAATPTPVRKYYRAPLKTVTQVNRELSKVYRECRAGLLSSAEAARYVYMLSVLARSLADGEIEKRIEAALQERGY